MRIALISTVATRTPPAAYGGTELVVAILARALARRGHDVTVFATLDSDPGVPVRALFADAQWPPHDFSELRHAAFAWETIAGAQFDVVHAHHQCALAFTRLVRVPCVATLHHDRVPQLVDHYRSHPEVAFVAISRRQAEITPEIRFARVIHHGLDPADYPFSPRPGAAVGFLGRLAPEKGPHAAIDAAQAAGVPIELGGSAHEVAREYFDREVAHRLAQRGVLWHGELSHGPKAQMLGRIGALLAPIAWDEPFGLVMIEAMLSGTPVIAYGRGSVPEIIDQGVTGFVVHGVDEMARHIPLALALDRRRVRRRAVERFSGDRMAAEYEALYESIVRRDRGALHRVQATA